MKKCSFFIATYALLVFFFLSICTSAYPHEWYMAKQTTITWDAVTTLENGAIISEDLIVEYKLWLSNIITDPDKANPTELGTTSETLYVVILPTNGRYFVGFQVLLKSSGGDFINESGIGWTDDSAIVANGATFGLEYPVPPALPSNVQRYAYTAVSFSWGESSGGPEGYRIYWGEAEGGPYPNRICEVNATVLVYTASLNSEQRYYVVCRAFNEYGESGNSDEVVWPKQN